MNKTDVKVDATKLETLKKNIPWDKLTPEQSQMIHDLIREYEAGYISYSQLMSAIEAIIHW